MQIDSSQAQSVQQSPHPYVFPSTLLREISFSDENLHFFVREAGDEQSSQMNCSGVNSETRRGMEICVEVLFSEHILITDIRLVSAYLDFSQGCFPFTSSKQAQFKFTDFFVNPEKQSDPIWEETLILPYSMSEKFEQAQNYHNNHEGSNQVLSLKKKKKHLSLNALLVSNSIQLIFSVSSESAGLVLKEFNDGVTEKTSQSNGMATCFESLPDSNQNEGEQENLLEVKMFDAEDAVNLFKVCFECFQIFGYRMNSIPNEIQRAHLLNIARVFEKNNQNEGCKAAQYLSGIALMEGKKLTQSTEIFSSICRQYKIERSTFLVEQKNIQITLAKIYLLIGENEIEAKRRVNAYKQALFFFLGEDNFQTKFSPSSSINLEIGGKLVEFAISVLQPREAIAIQNASIICLEFLLGILGCSLEMKIGLIISSCLRNFPKIIEDEEIQLISFPQNKSRASFSEIENYISQKGRATQESYIHLIETIITVLASMSSHILRQIFSDIILPILHQDKLSNFQLIITYRITEKIIAICQGDLKIPNSFLDCLFYENENEVQTQSQEKDFEVVLLQKQQLWETIKIKLIFNMKIEEINKIVIWISSKMSSLLSVKEEQDSNSQVISELQGRSLSNLMSLLDIIEVISTRIKSNQGQINQLSEQTYYNFEQFIKRNKKNNLSEQNIKFNSNKIDQEEEFNLVDKYFSKIPSNKNDIITRIEINSSLLAKQNSVSYQNPFGSLIQPLIRWVEHSLYSQSSLDVFKDIWQTLVDILTISMVDRQNPICIQSKLLFFEIASKLIEKVKTQLNESQPSILMLNFMQIILKSLPQIKSKTNQEPQRFISNLLLDYCEILPYLVFEESFDIFETLIFIAGNSLTESLLSKCIDGLKGDSIEKTLRQIQSMNIISKVLLEQTENINLIVQICLINNQEQPPRVNKNTKNSRTQGIIIDQKKAQQQKEVFFFRLEFFRIFLSNVSYNNFKKLLPYFRSGQIASSIQRLLKSESEEVILLGISISKSILEYFILSLIQQQESLKKASNDQIPESLQIIKQNFTLNFQSYFQHDNSEIDSISLNITEFVQEIVLFINKELPQRNSIIDFNSLLLLDLLFQTILNPRPTSLSDLESSSEIIENKSISSHKIISDALKNDSSTINRLSDSFNLFRLNTITSLIPFIDGLINSPWSNIRSIVYGIVCYWSRSIFTNRPNREHNRNDSDELQENLQKHIFKIVQALLESEESECRTGGLNIMGSLCGFGHNFEFETFNKQKLLSFLRLGEDKVPIELWKIIYDIQFDWDPTNQAAAVALTQLAIPKKIVMEFHRSQEDKFDTPPSSPSSQEIIIFWVELLNICDIKEYISMFKNEYKPPLTLWIETIRSKSILATTEQGCSINFDQKNAKWRDLAEDIGYEEQKTKSQFYPSAQYLGQTEFTEKERQDILDHELVKQLNEGLYSDQIVTNKQLIQSDFLGGQGNEYSIQQQKEVCQNKGEEQEVSFLPRFLINEDINQLPSSSSKQNSSNYLKFNYSESEFLDQPFQANSDSQISHLRFSFQNNFIRTEGNTFESINTGKEIGQLNSPSLENTVFEQVNICSLPLPAHTFQNESNEKLLNQQKNQIIYPNLEAQGVEKSKYSRIHDRTKEVSSRIQNISQRQHNPEKKYALFLNQTSKNTSKFPTFKNDNERLSKSALIQSNLNMSKDHFNSPKIKQKEQVISSHNFSKSTRESNLLTKSNSQNSISNNSLNLSDTNDKSRKLIKDIGVIQHQAVQGTEPINPMDYQEKLIKKLSKSKCLNLEDLKSVKKLHQQSTLQQQQSGIVGLNNLGTMKEQIRLTSREMDKLRQQFRNSTNYDFDLETISSVKLKEMNGQKSYSRQQNEQIDSELVPQISRSDQILKDQGLFVSISCDSQKLNLHSIPKYKIEEEKKQNSLFELDEVKNPSNFKLFDQYEPQSEEENTHLKSRGIYSTSTNKSSNQTINKLKIGMMRNDDALIGGQRTQNIKIFGNNAPNIGKGQQIKSSIHKSAKQLNFKNFKLQTEEKIIIKEKDRNDFIELNQNKVNKYFQENQKSE